MLVRAGTMGSVVVGVLCTPLDVARHQAQATFKKKVAAPGLVQALKQATAHGAGSAGLFRGLGATTCVAALAPVTFLLAYEAQRSYKDAIAAAAISRAVQVFVLQPFELLRTYRQAYVGPIGEAAPGTAVPAQSPSHLTRSLWEIAAQDRPRSLWRGTIPTLARDCIASSGLWFGYASLRGPLCGFDQARIVEDEYGEATLGQQTGSALMAAGLASGLAAVMAVVTQPFDTLRTRMMIHRQVWSDKQGFQRTRQARIAAIYKDIVSVGGYKVFWTGAVARASKAAIGGLLLGPLFEYCHHVADDSIRPKRYYLPMTADTTRNIVHPRQERSGFIEENRVRTGR
eukprot:TRINITY_DN17776_c0_g1_i4.p1 TRINITY_DN17776_c0_g1~~TRINITY_DN17776_c0_g1_i4.p1  ORF type:complete len:343 (+),score=39.35 TRINITY_DN17776_c0_g1_i4:93-1121(+)